MEVRQELVEILREARSLLALPGNDFVWSGWENADEALHEIDNLISAVEAGTLPDRLDISVLFAPTGSIQEVSLSSGWGQEFLELAARFDEVMERAYGR